MSCTVNDPDHGDANAVLLVQTFAMFSCSAGTTLLRQSVLEGPRRRLREYLQSSARNTRGSIKANSQLSLLRLNLALT